MNLKWLTIYFFIMCEIIIIKCFSVNENSLKHEKVKEDFGFLHKVFDRFIEFFKNEGDEGEELLQKRSANNKTIINVQIIKLDKNESKSRKQSENVRLNDTIFNTTSSGEPLNRNTKTIHNTQIVLSPNTSERKEKSISSTISSLLSVEEISTVLALNKNVLQSFERYTVHNLSSSSSNKFSGYTYEKPITPFSINLLQNNNSDLTPLKNDNLGEGLLKENPDISPNNDNHKTIRHTTNVTQTKTKPSELGTILHLNSSKFDKNKIKNNVSKVSNTFFADNVTVDTQKNISKNINPVIKNNNLSSNACWVMKHPKKSYVDKLPTTTHTNELKDLYVIRINKSETLTNLKQIHTSTPTTKTPITLESTKSTNSKIPKSNVTLETHKSDFSNVTKYENETNSNELLLYLQSSTKKPKDLIKPNNKSVIPISLKHNISANADTSAKKIMHSLNQNDTSSIQNANATENTKQELTSSTALPFNSYNDINKNKTKVTNKQDIVGLSSSQKQNISTKAPIPKPATTTNRPFNSANGMIVVQKENKMEIAANKPKEPKIITDSLDQAQHKLYDDNEILQDEKFEYLDVDGATDYPNIDYIEIYKDTTNEDVQYLLPQETTTHSSFDEINKEIELMNNKIQNVLEYTVSNKNFASDNEKLDSCRSDLNATDIYSTLSWIAAIFIKNGTSNQFDYYCDGALLSQSVVLTAARCVYNLNKTVDSNDIIVLLGKRSLHDTSPEEMVHRVNLIQIHDNFIMKGDVVKNDLALLHLEEVATYSKDVRPACFQDVGNSSVDAASTFGWKVSGELRPVYFVSSSENCKRNKLPDLICATYGNEVKICPNYGALYVVKTNNKWILKGIRHGDPSDREFCFEKDVIFTDLEGYKDWINLFSKV